jgi:CDP-diacylglycerol--glycerol-3-phosphate 3-phosphatidyltransferase
MSQQSDVILDTPLTIPNLLSSIRLVMAFTAGILFATANMEVFAVTLCLVAAILDAMDGWYARRFAQCSQLGKFLDPLADKILMAVVYGVIAIKMNSLPIWALFALITGRDFVVTASRTLQLRKRGATYPADKFGKAKMILQSAAGIGLLIYAYVLRDDFSFSPYPVVIILLAITALSYISAGRYLLAKTAK